jgi:hypothetical protein
VHQQARPGATRAFLARSLWAAACERDLARWLHHPTCHFDTDDEPTKHSSIKLRLPTPIPVNVTGLGILEPSEHWKTHMENLDDLSAIFGEPVSIYTRAQAISDGLLIDFSATAREAGFRIPVAMTLAAWDDCLAWPKRDSKRQTAQDEAGRLWDAVWMTYIAARNAKGSRCPFQLHRIERGGHSTRPRLTTLHLHIGPGDGGEPVSPS